MASKRSTAANSLWAACAASDSNVNRWTNRVGSSCRCLDSPSWGFPALSAAGNYLAGEVLGMDDGIIALTSKDGGATVSTHRLAGAGPQSEVISGSVLVDASGNIVLSYLREGIVITIPNSVLVRRSPDGGNTWTPLETVWSGASYPKVVDSAFVAGGTLLAWTTCPDWLIGCEIVEPRGP